MTIHNKDYQNKNRHINKLLTGINYGSKPAYDHDLSQRYYDQCVGLINHNPYRS